jgi:type I restriction enzyme R subunit
MPQPTPEYIYVEKPTIDQLISIGWQYIEGSWDHPLGTGNRVYRPDIVLLVNGIPSASSSAKP